MTAEQARAAFESAREVEPEPPSPLRREVPPAEKFPVSALGEILGNATRALRDKVQAPTAVECGRDCWRRLRAEPLTGGTDFCV